MHGQRTKRYEANNTYRIPSLDENCPRARKLAHQALGGRKARNEAARSDTLEHVLCVPRDEVAVVDDIFFTLGKLF